jgi:hypothetical protein
MKTISLNEAYDILENCSGIIVDDHVITYPSLFEILNDDDSDDNEFLYISYTESDGEDYSLKFTQGDNKQVTISGSSMFLYDSDSRGDDDVIQLTVLQPKNLE